MAFLARWQEECRGVLLARHSPATLGVKPAPHLVVVLQQRAPEIGGNPLVRSWHVLSMNPPEASHA